MRKGGPTFFLFALLLTTDLWALDNLTPKILFWGGLGLQGITFASSSAADRSTVKTFALLNLAGYGMQESSLIFYDISLRGPANKDTSSSEFFENPYSRGNRFYFYSIGLRLTGIASFLYGISKSNGLLEIASVPLFLSGEFLKYRSFFLFSGYSSNISFNVLPNIYLDNGKPILAVNSHLGYNF